MYGYILVVIWVCGGGGLQLSTVTPPEAGSQDPKTVALSTFDVTDALEDFSGTTSHGQQQASCHFLTFDSMSRTRYAPIPYIVL